MLPAYTGSFRFLGQDDKAGIHSIYGKKTGTSIFTGERVFCSSATYAMTNDLPPGVTVTSWSASPSSGVSISGSGNSRTLTRIGSFNNEVTLRATIANACAEVEVERKVWIGVPAIESVDFRNGSEHQGYFCSSQYGNEFKFSTYGDYATSMDMFEVQLLSYPGMAVLHTQTAVGGEGTLTYTPPPGWYISQARIINHPCGTGQWVGYEVEFIDCSSMYSMEDSPWKVFPNPANETMTVFPDNSGQADPAVGKTMPSAFTIVLYDSEGKRCLQGESRDGIIQIGTHNLIEGTYFLHIHHNGEVEKRQVVIRH